MRTVVLAGVDPLPDEQPLTQDNALVPEDPPCPSTLQMAQTPFQVTSDEESLQDDQDSASSSDDDKTPDTNTADLTWVSPKHKQLLL